MSATGRTGASPVAMAVLGAGAPEDLLNGVLGARGFAPVVMLGSLAELTAQLRTRTPHLVIVPVPMAGEGAEFAVFAAELRQHPGTAAIGTAPSKDADTVLAAMRAGVLEFLVAPPDRADLEAAVTRVLASATVPSSRGRVFTVFSAKGGLGTSTVAASLAWALAHRDDRPRVAFVDFTTSGAGVRVMLDLQPMYDLGSVVNRSATLDREFLRSCLFAHDEGVAILAAADELDAADPLSLAVASRVLELLREDFDYIVVDADHHFADPTLAALDAADRIVLVTHADVSALRSCQRSLGVFVRLGYPADKVMTVINRRADRDRISVSDAERVLGRRVDARLPNDFESCSDAITFGQFLQQHAPNSSLVGAFRTLAGMLAGDASVTEPTTNGHRTGSRLSRLFGRR